VNRVVIVGGGPGGYEAALVAAQLDAEVTVVDRDGLGGSAVLTDCVPSKTLIATAELMTSIEESRALGVGSGHAENLDAVASVDLAKINARVKRLAMQQL
jgi:NAD(P)H dehydrogenase (quinone)